MNITTNNAGSYRIVQAMAGRAPKPPTYDWVKLIVGSALLLSLIVARQAKAESTDKMAHLGVSYGATMLTYGLYKAILNKDCRLDNVARNCPLTKSEQLGAASFAAVTVFFVGLVKEGFVDRRPDGKDILFNGLGAAGAGLTVITFDF